MWFDIYSLNNPFYYSKKSVLFDQQPAVNIVGTESIVYTEVIAETKETEHDYSKLEVDTWGQN